jgi:hypothetical protein
MCIAPRVVLANLSLEELKVIYGKRGVELLNNCSRTPRKTRDSPGRSLKRTRKLPDGLFWNMKRMERL